ncbi:pre-mRNA-processing protein 40A [Cucumis melo var. makuwa]|uniref:Pre-mRNA-processing protein 40A n=1 Tax=Cucumis melo var. makuwa TaxID=1194695 RepID=A0A5A7VBX1_CUCMM|nr:pre-mRNA-processing protein 40A [Cucumis melo var. makuwa]
MENLSQSSGGQFRPVIPAQPGQTFISSSAQQFQLAGQNISSSNVGVPAGQVQPHQYPQSMPQLVPRPGHPSYVTPSSQPIQMPYVQTRQLTSVPPQSQQNVAAPNNHMHGLGAHGVPLSSPYTFQPMSQMHAPVSVGNSQPWLSSASQTANLVSPVDQANQHSSVSAVNPAANAPVFNQQSSSDWQEHASADGRRYYYNKKTKQSSWEKPLELMTPLERADASTVWKEFTAPDGRKYYYNKVTKESKWTMPEELKLAREQAQKEATQGTQIDVSVTTPQSTPAAGLSHAETPAISSVNSSISPTVSGVATSPVPVTPFVSVSNSPSVMVTGSSAITGTPIASSTSVSGTVSSQSVAASGGTGPPAVVHANASSVTPSESLASQDVKNTVDGTSTEDIEEARKGMAVAGKVNETVLEEKSADDEPLVFANKQEAKNAFKALLESVNVQSDWTWEQAMREIINDKRYGALKTLGERKQAFHEYLGHRKKLDAEERRIRQKKAREEFTKMLEESKELTSSTRWSKAVSMFENDERFKAVERSRDREDLFESYIVELERKEKERAAEEHKKNIAEYRKFLESCDYIKVSSQWRKVQDRLEDDERCSRLEKLDRLLIFQDYIRDLEKEEEDQKKIQKERVRRIERKNRDEFRKLMEEHIAAGVFTAKTFWRDYCLKVKELPQYQAVASNTSGSTPKDLFEDVLEELENKYHEEKTQIKDVVKAAKITITSSWTFDDFKAAIEESGSLAVSDINFKLVYEDLLERAKEKEEKEAKRRQRLADDFSGLLQSFKEITTSSNWEDSKQLFEESEEYRSIGEESFAKEVFEEHITHLQEKAKEKERKREEEKKDETDSENVDVSDTHVYREDKKRDKDKDRKHRKRHHSATDDGASDKDEREESKKSRKHGSDRKKSRKARECPRSP